ncbi:claudin-15a [Narcine bancroftii]|uniref:claudin-15a n=1 Tax=Narcine bancroftii TaxID=1343680 RepID=UPI0038315ACD
MPGGDAAGLGLGLLGWVLVAVCLANEEWKVSTLDGSVITTSTIYENLWKSCASDSTGVFNCRHFLTLFGLSDYVRVSQALMIISIVLGLFAVVVSIFGMQCFQLQRADPDEKAKVASAGGALFIVAALCAMVPVSWYAFNITRQFYDPLYSGTKYELGPGLYIGWAGGSLQIIGGICLCLTCKRASGVTGEYTYAYRTPRTSLVPVTKNYSSQVDHCSNFGKNAYV